MDSHRSLLFVAKALVLGIALSFSSAAFGSVNAASTSDSDESYENFESDILPRSVREMRRETSPPLVHSESLTLKKLRPEFKKESGKTRQPLHSVQMKSAIRTCTDTESPQDRDQDGWGNCNSNREYHLKLLSIKSINPKRPGGCDDLYFIIDGRRFPSSSDLSQDFELCKGERYNFEESSPVARRVMDWKKSWSLDDIDIELFDSDSTLDFGQINWENDDLMTDFSIQLEGKSHLQVLTFRKSGGSWPAQWEYEIRFQVEHLDFSDPNPKRSASDEDEDGMTEKEEFELARDLGGRGSLFRQNIFVEVDEMNGHELETNPKRMIQSQFFAHGYDLQLVRSNSIRSDQCLEKQEIRDLWVNDFDYKQYPAFHYLIMGGEIYNDTSGVSWYDTIVVNEGDLFVGGRLGGPVGVAGTVIHELGHQLGLTDEIFSGIDRIHNATYDSCMNYLFQVVDVDYSSGDSDGEGDKDFDDWDHIRLKATHRFDYGNYSEGRDRNPETNACL